MIRRAVAVGLVGPSLLLLTGCTLAPADPARSPAVASSSALTPREAEASVVRVGRAVIARLASTPWTLIAGPGAEACSPPGGGDGVSFSWAARGPGSADLDAAAATATHALADQGYRVRLDRTGPDVVRVLGASSRLGTVELDLQRDMAGISVVSPCLAGDAADYKGAPAEEPTPTGSPASP